MHFPEGSLAYKNELCAEVLRLRFFFPAFLRRKSGGMAVERASTRKASLSLGELDSILFSPYGTFILEGFIL